MVFRRILSGRGANWRRPVGFVLAGAIAGVGFFGIPSAAFADGTTAVPDIEIVKSQDGQPPFDANDDPGNDSGPDNDRVRTNDLVTYNVSMVINDGGASSQTTFQNTLATFTPLPLGFIWNSLPVDCSGPGSSLTGDGVTTPSVLVCDFGPKTAGTTWTLAPAVKVLRGVAAGTQLIPSATLSATDMVRTDTDVVDDELRVTAT